MRITLKSNSVELSFDFAALLSYRSDYACHVKENFTVLPDFRHMIRTIIACLLNQYRLSIMQCRFSKELMEIHLQRPMRKRTESAFY